MQAEGNAHCKLCRGHQPHSIILVKMALSIFVKIVVCIIRSWYTAQPYLAALIIFGDFIPLTGLISCFRLTGNTMRARSIRRKKPP